MKIANAPCSWGILEFGLDGTTDSYQKMLDEMSIAGYNGTELGDWGFLPTEPNLLQKELEIRDLKLVGAFVPVNFRKQEDHHAGLENALKIARLLGEVHSSEATIVLSDENGKDPLRRHNAGRIQPEHQLSSDEWKIFSNGVEKVARTVLDETGIPSVFHHHCAGFVESPDEIRILMERTDPELLGLCFDTGHYAYGGGNPVEGLSEHFSRIRHVHFKDFDPAIARKSKQNNWDYFESLENGIFSELGKGSIDFEKVLKRLEKEKYDGWVVVEQDILPGMGSPLESAKRNREYLRSIGL
ncbi:MAG: TIM barrel protein [Balneolaceae bacterium]